MLTQHGKAFIHTISMTSIFFFRIQIAGNAILLTCQNSILRLDKTSTWLASRTTIAIHVADE